MIEESRISYVDDAYRESMKLRQKYLEAMGGKKTIKLNKKNRKLKANEDNEEDVSTMLVVVSHNEEQKTTEVSDFLEQNKNQGINPIIS